MKKRKKQYILRKGNDYLECIIETYTGSGTCSRVLTPYKYDAARIGDLIRAKSIVRRICEEDEKWQVLLFEPLTGTEEKVWEY